MKAALLITASVVGLISASAIPSRQGDAAAGGEFLKRIARQAEGGSNGDCDFGLGDDLDLCSWENLDMSAFSWKASSGDNSFWIGGPAKDENDDSADGGYAVFETSQLPDSPTARNTVSAMLASPALESTGSEGYCVSFSYAMHGLSVDKLRLLLQPFDDDDDDDADADDDDDDAANSSGDDDPFKQLGIGRPRDGDDNQKGEFDLQAHSVLAELKDPTRGEWKAAQVMYSFPTKHKVILEAIPKDETDQARKYRGYIAVDDIKFESGDVCRGHCNFDSGLCSFTNDNSADFDWRVVSASFPDTVNIAAKQHCLFIRRKIELSLKSFKRTLFVL